MSSSAAEAECGKKTSWPEVVGMTIKEAKKVILKDRPDVQVVAVPVGTAVIDDFRLDRVRIWVDTVAETPRVG